MIPCPFIESKCGGNRGITCREALISYSQHNFVWNDNFIKCSMTLEAIKGHIRSPFILNFKTKIEIQSHPNYEWILILSICNYFIKWSMTSKVTFMLWRSFMIFFKLSDSITTLTDVLMENFYTYFLQNIGAIWRLISRLFSNWCAPGACGLINGQHLYITHTFSSLTFL